MDAGENERRNGGCSVERKASARSVRTSENVFESRPSPLPVAPGHLQHDRLDLLTVVTPPPQVFLYPH